MGYVGLMGALTDPGKRISSSKTRYRPGILDLESQSQDSCKRPRTIQHQELGLGFLVQFPPGDVNLRGYVNSCGSNSVVRRVDLLPAPFPLKREVQGPQRSNMPKRSPCASMPPITPVLSRRIDGIAGEELESKLEEELEPELDDEWSRPVRYYHNPTNLEELESYKRRVANLERKALTDAQHEHHQRHAHCDGRESSSSYKLIIQREEETKAKEKSKEMPLYKILFGRAKERDFKLKGLNLEVDLAAAKLEALQFAKKEIKSVNQIQNRIEAEKEGLWKDKEQHEEDEKENLVALRDVFRPLRDDEESDVAYALKNLNRSEVLVMHDSSNIEITRKILQCLLPNGWLNDEVINLYLELLKEREKREPNKYLKCHFFNTFFYKKLYSPMAKKYDYRAVKRWTTQKKIGYSLIDCDKIFVPIHKEIHWCLAIIDIRAKKFQYLDSLKGTDGQVLQVLARYLADEAKDKTGQDLDVSTWEQEVVEDIPKQENGWDCGMFMIKYADFHSQDLPLIFGQEHMPYFRKRTAKEILRLRAELSILLKTIQKQDILTGHIILSSSMRS